MMMTMIIIIAKSIFTVLIIVTVSPTTSISPPYLTRKLEVPCLLQQQLHVMEVLRQDGPARPHEVQDVAEHPTVPAQGRRWCSGAVWRSGAWCAGCNSGVVLFSVVYCGEECCSVVQGDVLW